MSSGIKKLKLNSTPNSSKLAEILLQLKDDVHNTNTMQPQNIMDDLAQTLQASASDATAKANNESPAPEEGHTLPASEACNCRKSKCLKLYCQCFAGRAICGQFCRCLQCENRSVNGATRTAAIKAVLDRNPNAFESKYKTTAILPTSSSSTEPHTLTTQDPHNNNHNTQAAIAHKNGCRCRKSLCLKKYCECFQGGVHCSNICTCLVCYNRSGAPLVANRVSSLPSNVDVSAQGNSVVEVHGAELLAKRSLSETGLGAYQPLDDVALLNPSYALAALNPRLSLSSTSSRERESGGSLGSPLTQDAVMIAATATLPPLSGALSKRRKSSPMSDSVSVDIRATPSSSAAALLSLNPAMAMQSLPPGTPSTLVHLPLRVEPITATAMATPFTLRSASPNSLSIAKALSLLGGSATLAQALDLANSLESSSLDIHQDLLTPQQRDSSFFASPSVSNVSSNSKDSISTAGESDVSTESEIQDARRAVLRKLDYNQAEASLQVFVESSSQ